MDSVPGLLDDMGKTENQGDERDTEMSDLRDRDRSRSPVGNDESGSRQRDDAGKNKSSDKYGRKPSTRQVHVANIPYSMTWQQLKDLFREKVGEVAFVRMFEDEDGRSKGMAIVEFSEEGAAEKAIKEMHRYEINSRRLVVKEDYEVDRDRHGRPLSASRMRNDRRAGGGGGLGGGGLGGGGGGAGIVRMGRSPDNDGFGGYSRLGANDRDMGGKNKHNFNTYGLSLEFLDSLGIRGPLINRVFVANLDYSVNEKKISDIFKMAGKIEHIDFLKDKDGKSRGRAIIEYEHPVEAVQAVSMYRKQRLFDRIMSVELDKVTKNDENRSYERRLPSGLSGLGRGLGADGQPLRVGGGSFVPPTVTPIGGSGLYPTVGNGGIGNAGIGGGLSGIGSNLGAASDLSGGLNPALASLTHQQLLALVQSGLLSGGQASGAMNSATLGNTALGGITGNSLANAGGISGLGGIGPNLSSANQFIDDSDRGYNGRVGGVQSLFNDNSIPSDTIIVRNLPMHFTWEKLREKFAHVGDVMFAEMRDHGAGLVRFSSTRDAERSINLMHQSRIEGHPIDVQLYDFIR